MSQALPSTPTTWKRATRRAEASSHQCSSTGHGPAHAATGCQASSAPARNRVGCPESPPRPLTLTGNPSVNLTPPGTLYGDRVRQWDLAAKKIFRLGGTRLTAGVDFYNILNNNVTLGFSGGFVPGVRGWQTPTSYMNPRIIRLNAEFAF